MPLGVLWLLLLFAVQVRRLIAHAILNKTIRKALEVDAESARLLIGKLEPRPRYADALSGWVLVLWGVAMALASLFGPADDQNDVLQTALIAAAIGGGIIAYAWWVERRTPA